MARPGVASSASSSVPPGDVAASRARPASPLNASRTSPAAANDLSVLEPNPRDDGAQLRLSRISRRQNQPPDFEERLRELEEQFDEQRFQIETLQQQLETERQARQAAIEAARPEMRRSQGYVVGTDTAMFASWNNGVELRSRNQDFYFHVGGRYQFDTVWMTQQDNALAGAGGFGAQDAFDFRRARLRAEGTIYDTIDWCTEYNFVSFFNNPVGPPLTGINQTTGVFATPAFTDLWWNFRYVPWLRNLTIGNIKEPFGLERLESSRFLDFMERSFEQDAFNAPSNNGFAPGILTWNYAENRRWTYAAGLFKNVQYTPYAFGVGDGAYAVDGRFTCLPYYDRASNGRYLMHIGLGGSWRGNLDGVVRYKARDALRNGPDGLTTTLVNTGFFNSQNQLLLTPEAAVVWGPWLFQAEFTGSWATQVVSAAHVPQGTVFASGYYVEALYFLTGEHRLYDYQKGLFGRVIPFENAAFVRGGDGRHVLTRGGWQVGARYNELNLNDKAIQGGKLRNVVLGLNWFLNPNMKIQWNVSMTDRFGPPGQGQGWIWGAGMRVAHDF